jgi:hypothetical protein
MCGRRSGKEGNYEESGSHFLVGPFGLKSGRDRRQAPPAHRPRPS